ncbi:MAG: L-serine ammonia-lyase, iron-sulfur-dependent, subunit alpha [Prevotella sp.]|nr:serine dehydratase subunit alpha family protein [Prevotella sp.]MCI6369919.1 L-serine ammonia-lyase, iron-sulfur-dependent, subunit alpha [Prevotella sp.]MCI6404126.1 L-serine ammonia-lyase, iron-sulfur-dependent, subunit alpha [Prevotella sp.]MCI6448594.1 L-serine ammonia-lyase, iron-sulfur-dependent, subunit alpha [Prevotella sp.]MCI6510867.1 L-serine ammonia-lyase, iron-sulfur-dependent, subunit alpha [Prevotella sp.]
MNKETRDQIVALIKREVVPAIGCTEPIAVALCVAKATETLGTMPESIDVLLSGNMLKNAMGVGIPGTGMSGLPIAIALGAIVGKSEYQLEVLKDSTPEHVEKGKAYIAEKRINISLKENITEKLYIEVTVKAGDNTASAIIAGGHTHFISITHNGEVLLSSKQKNGTQMENKDIELSLRMVYEFADTVPIEEIEFINEARRLNENASKKSLEGNYGHELGKTLSRPLGRGIMGDSMFSHILSATSSACDARMAGAMIPVMSNSGSGNQGIAATMPVVVFGEENHNTEDEITRALTLSHLTAIYIKQSLGRLSALCGCVVASTGSSCGITYLMGGTYEQVSYSVKNMIANLAGMVCDGAKPSCALKVTSGVSTAVLSAMLAIQNKHVTSVEGLVEDDVDRTIHNMTRIGAEGMNETDKMVLDIMTHKK